MEPSPSPDLPGATAPDLDQLVALAADAVAAAVAGGDAPAPDAVRLSPALAARGGAFVTLTVDGRLNGCIGTLDPAGPLGAEVVRLALGLRGRVNTAQAVPALRHLGFRVEERDPQ